MRIRQGTFSWLPDLTDDEIKAQIQYCMDKGWAVSVEYTDDPHPRNIYWEMWGLPMFDSTDASAAFSEVFSPGLTPAVRWLIPLTTSSSKVGPECSCGVRVQEERRHHASET